LLSSFLLLLRHPKGSQAATATATTSLSRAVAMEINARDKNNNQEQDEQEEVVASSPACSMACSTASAAASFVSVDGTMHDENNDDVDLDPACSCSTTGSTTKPTREYYRCSPAPSLWWWFQRRPPLLTIVTPANATAKATTTTSTTNAAASMESDFTHADTTTTTTRSTLFSFCMPSSVTPSAFTTTTDRTTQKEMTSRRRLVTTPGCFDSSSSSSSCNSESITAKKDSSPNPYHGWQLFAPSKTQQQQQQRRQQQHQQVQQTTTVALRHTTRTNAAKSWSFSSSSSSSSTALSSSSSSTSSLTYTLDELQLSHEPTPASNLRDTTKPVWIVTTATLPWFTGTAVNPLLRAAYLLLASLNSTSEEKKKENDVKEECNDMSGHTTHSSLREVHLVVPWLTLAEDRVALYGQAWRHSDQSQQEAYLRDWLVQQNLSLAAQHLHIHFYPARYHATLSSIFAMGDLCLCLTQLAAAAKSTTPTTRCFDLSQAICILEEPEHVNFYRAPTASHSWRGTFAHVVGIVHTNYQAYARQSSALHGVVTGPLVGAVSAWMVRAYCDKVIKLSSVLQEYAIEKEVVANVHGIRSCFFGKRDKEEKAVATAAAVMTTTTTGHDIYFIGKLLWAKGLDILLQELYPAYYKRTKQYFAMDVFGSGPDETEIQQAFLGSSTSVWLDQAENDDDDGGGTNKQASKRHGSVTTSSTMPLATLFRSSSLSSSSSLSLSSCSSASSASSSLWWKDPLPVRFRGPLDHAEISSQYKIFINPSVTEVLCTTTAEALAMGKFVICPKHPSNEFFLAFPNCLQYESSQQFVEMLQFAMNEQTLPEPLSPTLQQLLSWPAATERLFEAAAVSYRNLARYERVGGRIWDERCAVWHEKLGNGRHGDVLRKVMGGGPVADQSKYRSEALLLSSSTTTTTTTDSRQVSKQEQEVATTSISAVPVLVA